MTNKEFILLSEKEVKILKRNNQMKVYLVYKELGIDGIDLSSIKVFEHERDAFAYSFALKTHKDYNEDYYSVEVLAQEVI